VVTIGIVKQSAGGKKGIFCNLPRIICKFNFDRHLVTPWDAELCKIDEGCAAVKKDS
jgi:hypothetical protein